MANERKGNVLRVDTSTSFPGSAQIEGIKYVGAASGTAAVRAGDVSGMKMWEHSGNVIIFDEVCLREKDGIYIEVTNGAVVYLYL